MSETLAGWALHNILITLFGGQNTPSNPEPRSARQLGRTADLSAAQLMVGSFLIMSGCGSQSD